jgi:hypothetical protein
MAISAAMVKELRERTGLGMMDCKKALAEADGDMDKAIEDLRKKSSLKAAKKAGRTAANGLLGVKVADDGTRMAMVEVNIETDFAAKNEKFVAFVSKVAQALFDDGDIAACHRIAKCRARNLGSGNWREHDDSSWSSRGVCRRRPELLHARRSAPGRYRSIGEQVRRARPRFGHARCCDQSNGCEER